MTSLRHIKAAVFDFDGTLAVLNIDFDAMREKVFELIRQFGVREDAVKEGYLLEIIDEVHQMLWEKSRLTAEEFYQKSHQILHQVEMKAAGEGKLLPGTEGVLKRLREKGIKVGIITRNCEEAVRKVFPEIDRFCDVFISRNLVKKVKPHPDHLFAAIRALSVSGGEAVMIGDHTIDIQAGKRAGMMSIGVLTGRTKKEEFERAGADRVLKEASEIYKLLEEP
ncbi:MAG: HAD family hydrolase [Thermodesulfobacteriota bacterium]